MWDGHSLRLRSGQALSVAFDFFRARLAVTKAEVVRSYALLHADAGVNGQDVARPAEFLLGVIRWMNLTEDFRVRTRPEQIIEAAKALK